MTIIIVHSWISKIMSCYTLLDYINVNNNYCEVLKLLFQTASFDHLWNLSAGASLESSSSIMFWGRFSNKNLLLLMVQYSLPESERSWLWRVDERIPKLSRGGGSLCVDNSIGWNAIQWLINLSAPLSWSKWIINIKWLITVSGEAMIAPYIVLQNNFANYIKQFSK